MAKSLKAIVCPKCGSNKKKELKPDFYLCKSCNTEYFIDNDDITIIHKNVGYSPNTNTAPNRPNPKVIATILGAVFLFIVITFINLFRTPDYSSISSRNRDQISLKNLGDVETTIIQSAKGELYFTSVGTINNPDNNNSEVYAFFTNEKGKEIKRMKVNVGVPTNKASHFLKIVEMHNGDQYLIVNEKKVLRILPNQLDFKDITDELTQHEEFSSGFVKVKVEFEKSGFSILTMDGKSYVYMPLIDKIIRKDQFYDFSKKTLPNPTLKTYFELAKPNRGGIIDVPCKLVKYKVNYQEGYPIKSPPSWAFKYNQEGEIITDKYWKDYKFEAFLKDRIFFNPDILFYNDEVFIIKYTLDMTKEVPPIIQAIEIPTEKVLWTFNTEELNLNHYRFYHDKTVYTPENTLIAFSHSYLTIDNKTGKLVHFEEN